MKKNAKLKNFGVRLSNVVRPVYNDDTHPSFFANDGLGGLHVVRSLSEIEKCQQRLLIGMEVVSLDEKTLRDDKGNIVSSGGSPEKGRWRLEDATISCNASKFDCPLFKEFGSNKKCLLEHPNCRISSITNCKWTRLYDDKQKEPIHDWKKIIGIPINIQCLANEAEIPIIKLGGSDGSVMINSPAFGDDISFFDTDGKIDNRFLRTNDPPPVEKEGTIFWNERILVDHSFYPQFEWTEVIANEVLNRSRLEIGNKVEQVNIALMYNLMEVVFHSDNHSLRSFRLNNTKIRKFDARAVNMSLEELNLDDNEWLEEIWVSSEDSYKSKKITKYPLKSISVRNCPNLQKIHITDTQVTTINLLNCTRLTRLFADNTPMVNIIPQENYNDGTEKAEYPVYEECIHYFFRRSPITKIGYDAIYRALQPAHKEFVICLHTGNNSYATGSNTSIATTLGHLVSFDENSTF